MPGLWILLFISTLIVFLSIALVWLRVSAENRNRRLERMLQNTDSARSATVTTLLDGERPLAASPVSGAKPEPRTLGTGHRSWVLTAACALAGLLFGARFQGMFGPASLVPGAAVFAALPRLYMARKNRARMAAIEEQFPDALDFIARSVRAGNALSISLEMLAGEAREPLRSEFLKVSREQALGASLETALGNLLTRVPLIEARFFVAATLLQREAGGNLAEVLSRLAGSVRDRLRLRGHVKAVSGQGRLTAAILTVLPILVVVLLKLLSPGYLEGLTGDPLGRTLLGAAVVSQLLGYFAMKKIVHIEV